MLSFKNIKNNMNFNRLTIDEEKDTYDTPLKWQILGLMQTKSGYGSKLTTRKKIKIDNRYYRIYAVCYTNSSTIYVIHNKQKIYLTEY